MAEHEFNAEEETARVAAEVAAAPPPGEDPDSQARIAKHLRAQGVKLPSGMSDSVTDEDRDKYDEEVRGKVDADVKAAAERRSAEKSSGDAPTGRTGKEGQQKTTASTAADKTKA